MHIKNSPVVRMSAKADVYSTISQSAINVRNEQVFIRYSLLFELEMNDMETAFTQLDEVEDRSKFTWEPYEFKNH